ncbi:radical SAM protein [candidate division KSB3 bacterium]|uniref:Radical SAM protein n=1 Tax=candidate division KSB3 bacterium TaxID=2044937 RepID=A0A2G6EA33_9BACT|nr:MAG: radical SAM protein [candidate division KSB3 bacterium]PIE30997.1 MAG: radical SAM protein [candidate division KSB3 bacterium]
MKVMLCIPPGGYFAERWSQGSMMPSLGVLYLAAVLEQEAVDVEVVPSHVLKLNWENLARKFEHDKPDVIGISTTTENRFQSFQLAEIAKQARPEAFVLMGGPHFTGTARDTLTHISAIDGVISGEGELTIVELVKALQADGDLRKVDGLTFWDEGRIFENAARQRIPDLNTLPLPARHLIPWEKYHFQLEVPGKGMQPAANLMTSRGCPFHCTFCATPNNWGRRVRGLKPDNVLKELEHVIEHYNAKVIWFYDDTFNYNPRRTMQICDMIIERKLDIKWYCEVRVDLMTRELTEKMAAAGMFYAGFGIESGNHRVAQDIVKKVATLEQADKFIEWALECGVTPNPFFMFSHPTESWEESQETMTVIERVKDRCDISVAISHIYPGTELEARAYQEGKLPKDFSWTRKRDKRVLVLPAAQGHAPLYVDKLNWWQISELMFRFAGAKKKFSLLRKVPSVLKNIHSFDDVTRYVIMFLVFAKYKLKKMRRPRRGT